MALFCFCQLKENQDESGNYTIQGTHYKKVFLDKLMKVLVTGTEQYVQDGGDGRRHFPDVDVFECPVCGHIIVKG